MELVLGTFPVDSVTFGPSPGWNAGRLAIDPDRVRTLVLDDPRIRSVAVDLVEPPHERASLCRSHGRDEISQYDDRRRLRLGASAMDDAARKCRRCARPCRLR